MSSGKTGVLLLQLGTPDAPTAPALRRYLRQFLSDRRVIDLPRLPWWLLLNGIVLPRRAPKSAELYRRIWAPEGSPLLATSLKQAAALRERLAPETDSDIPVAVGMRYGNPSTSSAVDSLIRAGVDRIIAFPMYPQYAGATTGSSLEDLFDVIGRMRVVPPVRVVPPYASDPAYLRALVAVTRTFLERVAAPPEHLVVSFHGLPARFVAEGDPYQQQCEATFGRLAELLPWPRERMTLAYQSRFGKEPWLQPYTDETLQSLRAHGVRSVAVACPGFTADCLETLEEMGITNRKVFVREPGDAYHLIPCLNDAEAWIDAMTSIVTREGAGWISTEETGTRAAMPAAH